MLSSYHDHHRPVVVELLSDGKGEQRMNPVEVGEALAILQPMIPCEDVVLAPVFDVPSGS